MNEPEIVAASDADLREMAARRGGDDASRRRYLAFAERAPRGAWIARDAGTPVGIGFAHALDDEWFLSELFVEPSFRRQGIGARILREVARDAGDVWRSALLEAENVDAMAFFLEHGVGMQVPVMHIAGEIPKEDALVPLAAGDYRFGTVPIDARTHGGLLASLDREVRGSAREADHQLFAEHATGTLLLLNDEPVGYVYVWPDGRIGPMASASAAYLTQFLSFALVAMRRTYGASWCTMLIPGSNVRVLRAALRAGLKLDRSYVFASDLPALELSRYVGFHPLAF
ncbi:MAG TPA: GNAT family N-acetyltransferase [Candidatus Acidoferrales bacterium]|nr:GNAT family N-acetyltransferase [Candidatus Acidoferrales bacterium]